MNNRQREDAMKIAMTAINSCLPQESVRQALRDMTIPTSVTCIAIGKAAWTMAKSALDEWTTSIKQGIIITKDNHSMGRLPRMTVIETSHPVPDKRSVEAAEQTIEMIKTMDKNDHLLLLLSGGGSALFEKPLPGLTLKDLSDITEQLLASGAAIKDINTIRKRLSAIKAGRLAKLASPAQITTLILSDVLGDNLDSVASGPSMADMTTSEEALKLVEQYGLNISHCIHDALVEETPKKLTNSKVYAIGSVEQLCEKAKIEAEKLGYDSHILTTSLDCEAKEAGRFLVAIAREKKKKKNSGRERPLCLILGGETVVHLKGNGQGGRNQELALAAAIAMEGIEDCTLISIGSDGTDGPTDAAGGIVDSMSTKRMRNSGTVPLESLEKNDSYNALSSSGDLIKIGPTGTNVNDLILLMVN